MLTPFDALVIILKMIFFFGVVDIILTIIVWRVRMINRNMDRRERNKPLKTVVREDELHDSFW